MVFPGGGTGLPLPHSRTLRRQDLSCGTPGTGLVASGDGEGRGPTAASHRGFRSPRTGTAAVRLKEHELERETVH